MTNDTITNATTTCIVVGAHDLIFDVVESVQGRPVSQLVSLATPAVVFAVSLVLCFFGVYALRLVVGIAAFSCGIVGTVRFLYLSGQFGRDGDEAGAMSCDAMTLVVFLGGGVCTLIAVFMMRMLSTLLGAVATGGVVGAVFTVCGAACDADLWVGAPRILGATLVPFWVAVLLAAVAGGAVARRRHREMLATIASLLGGFGIAVSVRTLFAEGGGQPLPSLAFVSILGASTLIGLGTQYLVIVRRRRKKREAEEKKKRSDSGGFASFP